MRFFEKIIVSHVSKTIATINYGAKRRVRPTRKVFKHSNRRICMRKTTPDLVEISEDELKQGVSEGKLVPLGKPVILTRREVAERVNSGYPAYYTVRLANPHFEKILSEDIKEIAPRQATSYLLGERDFEPDGTLTIERYAVQFYKQTAV